MLIGATHVNATESCIMGEDPPCEPFTDNVGKLFRHCLKEFGKCVSKQYIDTKDGTKAIGWVFQRTEQYEDTKDKYIREVWVTLYEAPDTVTRTKHFHFI